MNNNTLLVLAKKWEEMAAPPSCVSAANELHEIESAAKEQGRRETLLKCADCLKTLVRVLG